MTFNTQHCYLKYSNCKKNIKEIKLDNQFCIIKNLKIINIIDKFTELNFDFIMLQECSHQLLKNIKSKYEDYEIMYVGRAIAHLNLKSDIIMDSKFAEYSNNKSKCNMRDYTTYTVTMYKKIYTCNKCLNIESNFSNLKYHKKSSDCDISETIYTDDDQSKKKVYRNLLVDLSDDKGKRYILLNLHYERNFRENKYKYRIGTFDDNNTIILIKYLNENFNVLHVNKLPIIIIGGDFNKKSLYELEDLNNSNVFTINNLLSFYKYNLFLKNYYYEYTNDIIKDQFKFIEDRIYYFKPNQKKKITEKAHFYNKNDIEFIQFVLINLMKLYDSQNYKESIIKILNNYLKVNEIELSLPIIIIESINKIVNLLFYFFINIDSIKDNKNLYINNLIYIIIEQLKIFKNEFTFLRILDDDDNIKNLFINNIKYDNIKIFINEKDKKLINNNINDFIINISNKIDKDYIKREIKIYKSDGFDVSDISDETVENEESDKTIENEESDETVENEESDETVEESDEIVDNEESPIYKKKKNKKKIISKKQEEIYLKQNIIDIKKLINIELPNSQYKLYENINLIFEYIPIIKKIKKLKKVRQIINEFKSLNEYNSFTKEIIYDEYFIKNFKIEGINTFDIGFNLTYDTLKDDYEIILNDKDKELIYDSIINSKFIGNEKDKNYNFYYTFSSILQIYIIINKLLFKTFILYDYIIYIKVLNFLDNHELFQMKTLTIFKNLLIEFNKQYINYFNIIFKIKLYLNKDKKDSLLYILNNKIDNLKKIILLYKKYIISIEKQNYNGVKVIIKIFIKILELFIELFFCIGYKNSNSNEKIINFINLDFLNNFNEYYNKSTVKNYLYEIVFLSYENSYINIYNDILKLKNNIFNDSLDIFTIFFINNKLNLYQKNEDYIYLQEKLLIFFDNNLKFETEIHDSPSHEFLFDKKFVDKKSTKIKFKYYKYKKKYLNLKKNIL